MPRPVTIFAFDRSKPPREAPVRRLRRRIEHAQPARIFDISLPEQIRVHARKKSEVVDRLLRSERNGKVQRRSKPGAFQPARSRAPDDSSAADSAHRRSRPDDPRSSPGPPSPAILPPRDPKPTAPMFRPGSSCVASRDTRTPRSSPPHPRPPEFRRRAADHSCPIHARPSA